MDEKTRNYLLRLNNDSDLYPDLKLPDAIETPDSLTKKGYQRGPGIWFENDMRGGIMNGYTCIIIDENIHKFLQLRLNKPFTATIRSLDEKIFRYHQLLAAYYDILSISPIYKFKFQSDKNEI